MPKGSAKLESGEREKGERRKEEEKKSMSSAESPINLDDDWDLMLFSGTTREPVTRSVEIGRERPRLETWQSPS